MYSWYSMRFLKRNCVKCPSKNDKENGLDIQLLLRFVTLAVSLSHLSFIANAYNFCFMYSQYLHSDWLSASLPSFCINIYNLNYVKYIFKGLKNINEFHLDLRRRLLHSVGYGHRY
uniref:Uncharacterized protein n=1 Tax=Heterorhabditis bacteriophora TaxID=37862 RepID=A0A1I7X508_HETBA